MSSTSAPFLTIAQAVQWTGKSDKTIRRLIRRYTDDSPELAKQYLEVRNRGQRKFWKLSAELLKQEFDLPDQYLDTLPAGSTSETKLFTETQESPEVSRTIDDWVELDRANKKTAQTNDQPVSKTKKVNDQDATADVSAPSKELTVLTKTVEELTRQLKVKDEQILANTKLLDRLTSTIEQGNFLVASAQQRIPMPDVAGQTSNTTDTVFQPHTAVSTAPLNSSVGQLKKDVLNKPFSNDSKERRSWLKWLYGWMEE
jgi:hypothetical protein